MDRSEAAQRRRNPAGEASSQLEGTVLLFRDMPRILRTRQGVRKIFSPLNRSTAENEPFEFQLLNDADLHVFKDLKKLLFSPLTLTMLCRGRKHKLDADALGRYVGCTLLQEQPDGANPPIGYWIYAFSEADCNYTTTAREYLAVV